MLEEFTASLASSRIVAWPSLERLLSPPVVPQPQDEAPVVAATQLEDEDPAAVVSGALRTPPPRPIHWAVDSTLPAHCRWIPTRLRTTTTPPNAASIASSTK